MEDAVWLASDDVLSMLHVLQGGSGRKFRLFATACAWDEFDAGAIPEWECPSALLPEYRDSIIAAERYADGGPSPSLPRTNHWVSLPVCDVITHEDVAYSALGFSADVGLWLRPRADVVPEIIRRYRTHPANSIRDIFGNPFRPVTFDPEWRNEHTVGLAAKMYEDREFAAMPILADALEETGCDNADILSHCREPGVHVRGCWVVDLVLGKE